MDYGVRRARTSDVLAIRALVDANVNSGRLLDKATVTLYEDIQEFWVATTPDREIAGCGALHVMWEDLAEMRTLAVSSDHQGRGAGNLIVAALLDTAREVGVSRVFVLTFAVEFFRKHTALPRSLGRRPLPRCMPSCCALMTRASLSSSISTE